MKADKGEARINYHVMEIESASNLIALVESEIKHKIFNKKIDC